MHFHRNIFNCNFIQIAMTEQSALYVADFACGVEKEALLRHFLIFRNIRHLCYDIVKNKSGADKQSHNFVDIKFVLLNIYFQI